MIFDLNSIYLQFCFCSPSRSSIQEDQKLKDEQNDPENGSVLTIKDQDPRDGTQTPNNKQLLEHRDHSGKIAKIESNAQLVYQR